MSNQSRSEDGAVIALAGRRIDAADTNPPRFPLEAVPTVRRRLADLLAKERAVALVCSAACGADLMALEEAERLGLRRRIVLPFPPERFRKTSVIDRPGDWAASIRSPYCGRRGNWRPRRSTCHFRQLTMQLMSARTKLSFARHSKSLEIAVRID